MKLFIQSVVILIMMTNLQCTKKDNYSGYETISQKRVDAIGSDLVEMKHTKSGATVVLIKNSDQARSFMVGFRTPPYDDTGLFHIFEHAVLEGSRLYPSKSNFFHLANSSVASFINAMTGPVYTFYPYVTRSDKDFDNLLSTYLDAVFFPNVLEDPRIIQREGWRYEVNPETKKMSINGIVLSEMKGAYSNPYRLVWSEASSAMVPNTPFAFSSGGHPEKIATLTFEQIKDAHKKYYHPQNSVIMLYGDIDYKKTLAEIDKSFLNEFTASKDFKRPEIPVQQDFNYPTKVVEKTYPGENGKKKDFLTKGYVFGADLTPLEESAAAVLMQAFIGNDAAPLKLRLLKEGLASSAFNMGVGGEENAMALVFEGTNAEDREKIDGVVREEIQKVVTGGMDSNLLTSILNKYEFSYKEKNANGSLKGLQLANIVLENWLYQDQPLDETLDFVTHFKKLRLMLSDQAYVKEFFKSKLQDNQKVRWIVLRPDPDFSRKFNAGLDTILEKALKEKPVETYLKDFQEYQEWVAAKEPQEVIAKVPTLELSDIAEDEKPIPQVKTQDGQTQIIEYAQNTTGIEYLNLYFDLSAVPEENLKNLELLTSFIKKTNTTTRDFETLSKELDTYVGGLNLSVSTYQSYKNPENFKPTLTVSARFISENRSKAMELIQDLLTQAQFEPETRIGDLLNEMKTGMVSGVSSRAPSLSVQAATRQFFPQMGAFNEIVDGGNFENYVLNSSPTTSELIKQLRDLRAVIFNQNQLYLATLTADQEDMKPLLAQVKELKKSLSNDELPAQTWSFNKQKFYDGYAIPGEVQYVAQAASYKKQGLDYNGSMKVYERYLNNNYMLPKLREQAGAYGGGSSFQRNGLFLMTTYRDPHLKRSLETFADSVDYMAKEELTSETLKPAILGSLKTYYSDSSVYDKTSFMTNLYLTDLTWDDYLKTKHEILSTKPEDIKRISAALKNALKDAETSAAGNPAKLKAEAQFLKNVLSIQ